jgi:hypothetical protein
VIVERGHRRDVYRWLWLAALLCLCLRLGHVLTHEPLAGFANQFDMLRTTGCLGLAPAADVAAGVATPAAPIERYRVAAARDPSCLIGTEVLLAGTARALDEIGDVLGIGDPASMPLRLVAWTKAILLLLAVGWIDWRLRAHRGARVVHAGLAAVVLVDPFNTLYLAGFYTEFAALLSAWLALALPLTWILDGRAPGHRGAIGWGLILAALALSRFQHAVIPLLLLVWLLLLARRARWAAGPLLLWPALVLLPALALQLSVQGQYQTIADANRWNSFFGAAMPAAGDATRFARELDLPQRCAELVHTTWYLQRGRDARAECPQAFALSRVRWLAQLASEPAAIARLVGRGVSLSGQWRPGYLGEVAGGQFERLPVGRAGLGASLADAVARLPFAWLLALWAMPLLLLAGLAGADPRERRARGRSLLVDRASEPDGRLAALWLWPLLALIVGLGWGASLVGDGYSELARHLHLAANAMLVALALGLLALLRAGIGFAPQVSSRTRWAVLATFLLLLGLGAFVGRQSLGYGVLDRPADERASGTLELAGWAMDPRGVRAVEAVWSDGQRQALTLQPRPELARIFGFAAPAVGFAGQVQVPTTPDPQLRIELLPISGPATVIDRRWLR